MSNESRPLGPLETAVLNGCARYLAKPTVITVRIPRSAADRKTKLADLVKRAREEDVAERKRRRDEQDRQAAVARAAKRVRVEDVISTKNMRRMARAAMKDCTMNDLNFSAEAIDALRLYYTEIATELMDYAILHRNVRRTNPNLSTELDVVDLHCAALASAPTPHIKQLYHGKIANGVIEAKKNVDFSEKYRKFVEGGKALRAATETRD